MMPHVDMAKVESSIDRAKEMLRPIAKENTSRGAQARMSIVVDTAFSRQLAEEINRGTSVDLVSDALAAVCANMISSMAQSVLGGDVDRGGLTSMCNAQLFKVARCLMHQFDGETEEVYHGSVDLEDGGHA
jgi:endonuclease III